LYLALVARNQITQLPDYKITNFSMPSTRSIEVLASAADLFHAAAEEFVRAARTAIGAQGRFTVALSGGSTPKALYSLLATITPALPGTASFYFSATSVTSLPPTPKANYRMVNESLLTKIAIPAGERLSCGGRESDATAASSEYEAQLRRFFELKSGEFPRFDLILLGSVPMATTASLFPDSPALNEESRLVVANWVAKFNAHRIPSPSVLNPRRRSHVPGQWSGQSRHGASGSRGQEHASTAPRKGCSHPTENCCGCSTKPPPQN